MLFSSKYLQLSQYDFNIKNEFVNLSEILAIFEPRKARELENTFLIISLSQRETVPTRDEYIRYCKMFIILYLNVNKCYFSHNYLVNFVRRLFLVKISNKISARLSFTLTNVEKMLELASRKLFLNIPTHFIKKKNAIRQFEHQIYLCY